MLWLQAVDSITTFQAIFGFVGKRWEMFDLDGHNLGTIQLNIAPTLTSPPLNPMINIFLMDNQDGKDDVNAWILKGYLIIHSAS